MLPAPGWGAPNSHRSEALRFIDYSFNFETKLVFEHVLKSIYPKLSKQLKNTLSSTSGDKFWILQFRLPQGPVVVARN